LPASCPVGTGAARATHARRSARTAVTVRSHGTASAEQRYAEQAGVSALPRVATRAAGTPRAASSADISICSRLGRILTRRANPAGPADATRSTTTTGTSGTEQQAAGRTGASGTTDAAIRAVLSDATIDAVRAGGTGSAGSPIAEHKRSTSTAAARTGVDTGYARTTGASVAEHQPCVAAVADCRRASAAAEHQRAISAIAGRRRATAAKQQPAAAALGAISRGRTAVADQQSAVTAVARRGGCTVTDQNVHRVPEQAAESGKLNFISRHHHWSRWRQDTQRTGEPGGTTTGYDAGRQRRLGHSPLTNR
jgi:hypothetical protein